MTRVGRSRLMRGVSPTGKGEPPVCAVPRHLEGDPHGPPAFPRLGGQSGAAPARDCPHIYERVRYARVAGATRGQTYGLLTEPESRRSMRSAVFGARRGADGRV